MLVRTCVFISSGTLQNPEHTAYMCFLYVREFGHIDISMMNLGNPNGFWNLCLLPVLETNDSYSCLWGYYLNGDGSVDSPNDCSGIPILEHRAYDKIAAQFYGFRAHCLPFLPFIMHRLTAMNSSHCPEIEHIAMYERPKHNNQESLEGDSSPNLHICSAPIQSLKVWGGKFIAGNKRRIPCSEEMTAFLNKPTVTKFWLNWNTSDCPGSQS